jgi:hypothetical protein
LNLPPYAHFPIDGNRARVNGAPCFYACAAG